MASIMTLSDRFYSYWHQDFPAVSVFTGRDFLAVSAVTGCFSLQGPEGWDFPAVFVVSGRDFPAVAFLA
jgi:hypothetical protein